MRKKRGHDAELGTVVAVTGVPGSGKTTLARQLAVELDASVLSLDTVKEQLHAASGDRLDGAELRRAAEAVVEERLLASTGLVVLDIWIQPGRDSDRVSGLLARASSRAVEVVCRVPADVAVDRYVRRVRSGPHRPPDRDTLQRIRLAAAAHDFLRLPRCREVDTSRPVDAQALAVDVRALLGDDT